MHFGHLLSNVVVPLALVASSVFIDKAEASSGPDDRAGVTCNNWSIVPNTADLSAACEDVGGNYHSTRISIGACVVNNNGQLSCSAKCVISSLVSGIPFMTAY
ncbi:hypothetical protein BDW22DRAFT_1357325 [Trametopsis cervina]|nr:hypothetical protein BDW22DRAFT_1357325 [Trametopsis cervina]